MTFERRIQEISIKFRNRQLRTQEAAREREVVSYATVKQVGLLFRAPELEQAKGIDLLVQGLLADGKSVTAFTFLDDEPSPDCKVPFKAFRPGDMDMWGRIKVEVLNRFLDAPIDYLVCISPNAVPEFEYLLMRSHALCRIGTRASAPEALFELLFELPAGGGVQACQQMLHYLRRLKGQYQRPAYLRD